MSRVSQAPSTTMRDVVREVREKEPRDGHIITEREHRERVTVAAYRAVSSRTHEKRNRKS